ncbi:MAG: DUF1992 domain-containing protein [Myxococcales bacterium]
MALKAVEEAIQAARERGEFDDLKGRGKPLDHSEYFSQPEALRVAHHLLKNSGFVPPEIEILKQRGELRAQLARTEAPAERRALHAKNRSPRPQARPDAQRQALTMVT